MEALERRGTVAEALLAYDRLRVRLSDELGVGPSPVVQSVHSPPAEREVQRFAGDFTSTPASMGAPRPTHWW
jgi:DNA-binding SARP family transcriptional activator